MSAILQILMLLVLDLVLSEPNSCPANCICDSATSSISCTEASLTTVPWNLPDPVGLRHLVLRNNEIDQLRSQIVSYANLESLDLGRNLITSINGAVFNALPKLTELKLDENRIDFLNADTFQGLISLELLNIKENNIKFLANGTFSSLKKLKNLDISGNDITGIGTIAFQDCTSLTNLKCSYNKLHRIPTLALNNLYKLEEIDLSFNEIKTIQKHQLSDFRNLKKLILEGNLISFISEATFSDGPTLHIHLEELNLKSNHLLEVPYRFLRSVSRTLKKLDVSNNPIETIKSGNFDEMDHLEIVKVNSMTELKKIDNFAFAELLSLDQIEIHSNYKLEEISERSFVGCTSLKRVDLHANSLHTLSANVFEWDNLHFIDLRFNPWTCDCHLQWLPDILNSLRSESVRRLSQQAKCSAPEKNAAKAIFSLEETDLFCKLDDSSKKEEFKDHVMVAIFGGFVIMLSFVLVVLLYKRRYSRCCHRLRHDRMGHSENESSVIYVMEGESNSHSERN